MRGATRKNDGQEYECNVKQFKRRPSVKVTKKIAVLPLDIISACFYRVKMYSRNAKASDDHQGLGSINDRKVKSSEKTYT